MNTLILDKENMVNLKDNTYELDSKEKEITLIIEGTVSLNELNKKEEEKIINIKMKDNATLLYNRYIHHEKSSIVLNIEQQNKTKVIINYSCLADNACYIKMNTHVIGSNNSATLNIRAVTEKKGHAIIEATAEVNKNTKENQLLENIKVLVTNEEESRIIPNLLVSSSEVEVNHAAAISGINQSDLFYLNTKGISEFEAIKLIKNGFLLSNLQIEKEENNRR